MNLDKESPLQAFVFLLLRQPALTQEHVNLLRVHIQHLHLVQVPVGPYHGVVVTNSDLKHLTQVDRFNGEFVHLETK